MNKNMEIANLTCRSVSGDKELLDIFENYFYEAIKNQEVPGARNSETLLYKFIDLHFSQFNNELVLYGRFVKSLNIKREQILEGDLLVQSKDSLDSAPSSFFVLILSNHKILWLKETSRAPGLKDLQAALLKMLKQERESLIKDFILNNSQQLNYEENQNNDFEQKAYQTYPQLELTITPLGNNVQIKERLSNFVDIHNITLKALKRNNEMGSDFSKLAELMSTTQEEMSAKNVKTVIHGDTKNPLNKNAATNLIQAVSDGNYEYQIQGIDSKSNKIVETNETLSLASIVNYIKDNIIQTVKNMIDKYFEVVNAYNNMPRQNVDTDNKIKELEEKFLE